MWKDFRSELSLELVLALLQLLLVLLLSEERRESLVLLVRLVGRGKRWGWRRPLRKRWSAGDVAKGSAEGESGVRDPNSKSDSGVGVLRKEKESPEGDVLMLFLLSMEGWVVMRKLGFIYICVSP